MISWEDLIYIADLFEREPQRHLSLLGGEPTLHPHFVDYVLYLTTRRFHTTIFTCGIMSPKRLKEAVEALKSVDDALYSFVVNLNHPDMSTPSETERIEAFLSEFGKQSTLSFNIFTLAFEMDYLFDYIERFNLRRHIRLGLAHPIPGEKNLYIPPDSFDQMAEKLSSYVPRFIEHNVSAGFDCGFPLCNFTDEQIGKFFKLGKGSGTSPVKFVCNPALDIGPDMTVWSCFPLSRYHKRSLYEFNSVQEVIEYYKTFHRDVRNSEAGIYPKCEQCVYRENEQCAGGCLAHILNRQEAAGAAAKGTTA